MARTYTDAARAEVMAALLTGQSIREVAGNYQIPRSTVAAWAKEVRGGLPVPDTKKEATGALLLDYLRTMLHTLKVQAEHFGDKTWLAKQNAADLAVLHGVSVDKAVRLLEALDGGYADNGKT